MRRLINALKVRLMCHCLFYVSVSFASLCTYLCVFVTVCSCFDFSSDTTKMRRFINILMAMLVLVLYVENKMCDTLLFFNPKLV